MATSRLRLSARSMAVAVALLGLTLVVLRLFAASGRVIGWVLTAVILAGLLHPAVEALRRRLPRGLALVAVVVTTLALGAGVAYAVVDDIVVEVRELQAEVPDAARRLERSERFGDAARDFEAGERAERFVDELPERLRGGEVRDALRSAATRGVAFLATGVLTIFFLVHGPNLLRAASRQVSDDDLRRRLSGIGAAAYRRSTRYVAGSLTMATTAGLLAYLCAEVADVPGKAPLALSMAVFDLVPLLGVVAGALPLVLLSAATNPAPVTVAVAVALAGYQVFEALVLQPRVEDASLHVGPFVTVAVGMIGLELYGFGGALVSVVLAVVALAVVDEVVADRARAAPQGDGSGASVVSVASPP